MNSMGNGGAPQNKLQAMMQGMMGGNSGMSQMAQSGPQQKGPGPDQPTGSPRPNDPAYPGFVKISQGLKSLAEMLNQLGDQSSSTQVEQMKLDLMKLAEARQNDFVKAQELKMKLGYGAGGDNIGGEAQEQLSRPDQQM